MENWLGMPKSELVPADPNYLKSDEGVVEGYEGLIL